MLKIKLEDGRIVEAPDPDSIKLRESCEAEKALGFNLAQGGTAAIAICLFVGFRREDPDKAAGLVADEVLNVEFSQWEEEEDPPADGSGSTQTPPASGAQP